MVSGLRTTVTLLTGVLKGGKMAPSNDGEALMKVEDLRHQYPDQWILLAVEEKDAMGVPVKGQLLAHGQDAETLWDGIAEKQGQLYIFYTGEILKDTAVIFCSPEDYGWLKLAELSFGFWDNEEDAIYDQL
jgi:hypothetical protein